MAGQTQCIGDVGIELSRSGADQSRGGGVGILSSCRTAEGVHQVLGDHQHTCHTLQTAAAAVVIELIDGVEGLKLAACAAVELREGDEGVYLVDDGLRPLVAVGEHGTDDLAAAQQHIVHAPGVDGEALDSAKVIDGLVNACLYMALQCIDVPCKMAVLFRDTVGEAVDLLGAEVAPLSPAYNVATGRGAYINGNLSRNVYTKIIESSFKL